MRFRCTFRYTLSCTVKYTLNSKIKCNIKCIYFVTFFQQVHPQVHFLVNRQVHFLMNYLVQFCALMNALTNATTLTIFFLINNQKFKQSPRKSLICLKICKQFAGENKRRKLNNPLRVQAKTLFLHRKSKRNAHFWTC